MSGQVEVRKVGFAHWRWAAYAPPYAYRCAVGWAWSKSLGLRKGQKALDWWTQRQVVNV